MKLKEEAVQPLLIELLEYVKPLKNSMKVYFLNNIKKMIKRNIIITKLLVLASFFPLICFGQNPIIQTNYTADPAPMVHNGTVYLYTTHDEDKTVRNFFTMNDWRCYSSTDMVNWTDHGAILSYTDFSWSRGDAWAGQCVYRNGKFYFYVPINQKNGGNAIGVAVSDNPTGPFRDALGKPLLIGYGCIDPTVFIDDDGQAYLYWGNPNLWYVKLNEDMISYSGSVVQEPTKPSNYVEGPWFYKHNGLYYMVFAAGPIPEYIAYSTSTDPTGPWTYMDTIMPVIQVGGAFTNHPGIIDYKGKSYFFYHNGALPGGGGFNRSVCVEEFTYNADSTIPTINATSAGIVNSAGHLNPYGRIEFETIALESGIETDSSNEVGIYVTDIDSGDYIKVRSIDFGASGAATFTANVACAFWGGTIELHLDSPDGLLIGTLTVSYTGGWDQWKTETTNISGATGIHDLFLVFKGEAKGDLFRADHWMFGEMSPNRNLFAINATVDKYKIDTVSGSNMSNIVVMAIYTDGTSEDITAQATAIPDQDNVVTINNGQITGTGYSPVKISVDYKGKSDVINLIVKDLVSEQTVKELTADIDNVTLITGSTLSFTITATYVDGHTEDVTQNATYTNSHPEIADVTKGSITAISKGTTNVTVSFKGEKGKAETVQINIDVTNRDPFTQNEAEEYSQQSGVQTENCSDTGGGINVGYIENGDWLRFNSLDFGSGAVSFEARVASATNGGNLEIRLDSPTGTLAGTCVVPGTGDWQTWVTKSCSVSGLSGIHDIYLKFIEGSDYLFNINWWKFKPKQTEVVPEENSSSNETPHSFF